ncbi:hypothetical protein GGU10DRAFT_368297 [Lentinula aff. detonsa]|uniref:Uncharacterized protein n=1 Tax=Lentinula aff. detonsa TaxID=2804958 RepID=A0AA38KKX6_9AGAR|nr:hypothetical protein GGU10DRAFT_368297 [Lentinula aff. detonsa]
MRLDSVTVFLLSLCFFSNTTTAIPFPSENTSTPMYSRASGPEVHVKFTQSGDKVQQDVSAWMNEGLKYAFNKVPHLGSSDSTFTLDPPIPKRSGPKLTFEFSNDSPLCVPKCTGSLLANPFDLVKSHMIVYDKDKKQIIEIGPTTNQKAHFYHENNEIVVVEGPYSSVDHAAAELGAFGFRRA